MTVVHPFFEEYRRTFSRFDRDALVELFVYPVQIVSAAGGAASVLTVDRTDWPGVVDGLFGAYRTLGVVDAQPLAFAVLEVTPQVFSARVHWELRRGDGSAVYDFTAIYSVVGRESDLGIAAIAHDELPKLEAALTAT